MHAELIVEQGAEPGRRIPLPPGERVVLGRGREATAQLRDPDVSREHVAVELTPDGLYALELGSRNGTTLQGARLPPRQPRPVADGDVLLLGGHALRVSLRRDATPSPSDPPRLRDEFEVMRELGRGAYGVVYAARHRASGQPVAIKALREEVDPASRPGQRFLREARVRIESPFVARVHDLRLEEQTAYLILEYVPGRALDEHARAGPLPLADVLRIGEEVARGLSAAHRAGVVHRDLKPANVLITPEGHAKITDFGLAKAGDVSRALTATGEGLGSMAYVAPEQAEDAKRAAPTADLYSLGVTLYELIAGAPPFAPTNLEDLARILDEEPAPLEVVRADCPAAVAALVHRLLEKDPDDRPQDALLVAERLQALRERLAPDDRGAEGPRGGA